MLKSLKTGPIVISGLVTAGFFGITALMLFRPVALDDKIAALLNIAFGNLSAAFGAVVQYHIGSSAGSASKTDILHQIAAKVTGTDGSGGAGGTP